MSHPVEPLNSSPDLDPAVAEIVAEITDRLHAGQAVQLSEYLARHPEHADRLRRLLPALVALEDIDRVATPDGSETERCGGVLGDFRILREVGRGGMGVVYEAEQISLRRGVALKVLPFAATMDARQLQRFQNEARAAAGLHHAHIVPVYAVGSERGVHYYAMQFIDGRTLAQVIAGLRDGTPSAASQPRSPDLHGASTVDQPAARDPSVSEAAPITTAEGRQSATVPGGMRQAAFFRRVAAWGIEAAEALEHAHRVGIVHRDVKPGNLMIDGQGKLWVTDFGLAQTAADSGLTLTGDLVGTLRYMSPEQALAKHGLVDHRTDVYSLGVTLYELLTLRPAVVGEDRQQILRRVVEEEPPAPRSLNRGLSRDLETVVLKAMAKEPSERYASARDLAEDLQRVLDDRMIQAKRPTLAQRGAKWARRHQSLVATVALFLAVVTVGALVSIWLLWLERSRTLGEAAAKDIALTRVESERDRADANFRKALDAVGFLASRLDERRPDLSPDASQLRRTVLDAARDYFQAFLDKNKNDPALRLETALAHKYLGEVHHRQDDFEMAHEVLKRAFDLFLDLAKELPDDPRPGRELEDLRKRFLTLTKDLHMKGHALEKAGRFTEAEGLYRRAGNLVEHYGTDHPEAEPILVAVFLVDLSRALEATGQMPEAAVALRKAIDCYQQQAAVEPSLSEGSRAMGAKTYLDLGHVLAANGEVAGAYTTYCQGLKQWRELPAGARNLYLDHVIQARFENGLGDTLWALGRTDEAREAYRRALPHLQGEALIWLLSTCPDLKVRNPQKAVELAEGQVEAVEKKTDAPPRERARVWIALGVARCAAQTWGPAVEALEKAHQLGPFDPRGSLFCLAMAHWQLGDKEQARRWFAKAVQWMDKHKPKDEVLLRFRAEAATLLGVKDPAPPDR